MLSFSFFVMYAPARHHTLSPPIVFFALITSFPCNFVSACCPKLIYCLLYVLNSGAQPVTQSSITFEYWHYIALNFVIRFNVPWIDTHLRLLLCTCAIPLLIIIDTSNVGLSYSLFFPTWGWFAFTRLIAIQNRDIAIIHHFIV